MITKRRVLNRELTNLEFLTGEGSYHADAGQVFLQHRRQLCFSFVHGLEKLFDLLEKEHSRYEQDRHRHQRKPGHTWIQVEENRHDNDQHQYRAADFDHLAREKNPDGFHVRGTTLHQVPGISVVMETAGQMFYVIK